MATRLNVGCGTNYIHGWTNLDACGLFKRDMALTLPGDKLEAMFGRESVDEILMNDVLEHLYRCDGVEVLKDLFAVLKQGGTARIGTTDLERIIMDRQLTLQRKTELIRGAQGQNVLCRTDDRTRQAWREFPKLFAHPYTWTEQELKKVMWEIGFVKMETEWKEPWSMVVSATRDKVDGLKEGVAS